MEGSLRHFKVAQGFLGFLRCENLAGFALSPCQCLWLESLSIDHLLAMRESVKMFPTAQPAAQPPNAARRDHGMAAATHRTTLIGGRAYPEAVACIGRLLARSSQSGTSAIRSLSGGKADVARTTHFSSV